MISPSWFQAFDEADDTRAIQLQLSTDGVNPFSSNKVAYSMWPILLSHLNLPRSVRTYFGNIMLVGIVPAQPGGGEPKNLDPYLEIVVDELLLLNGQSFYDAFEKESFEFKVSLLNFVLDYPGCAKVFCAAGPTALQACLWCELRGIYIKDLDKVVFLKNRRYLPARHALRHDDKECFPSKKAETKTSPANITNIDIMANAVAYEKAKNKTHAANVMKATGSKGVNCFMLLPNNDRIKQTFPDVMHNIKNVIAAFYDLFTGKGYNAKVKTLEDNLGRFQNLQDQQQGPPFVLTKSEIQLADERLKRVNVPTGYDFQPRPFFKKKIYLKSHDYKQLAVDGILKFVLRDCLGERQRRTFFHLLDVISCICDEVQDQCSLDDLEREVNLVCAEMERDFPIAIQTISFHILHHIVDGIKLQGPVHSWWMYVYERLNSWICQRVKNRRHPEVNVMETYRLFDWVQFMKLSDCIKLPSVIDYSHGKSRDPDSYKPTAGEKQDIIKHLKANLEFENLNIIRKSSFKAKCNSTQLVTWKENTISVYFLTPTRSRLESYNTL